MTWKAVPDFHIRELKETKKRLDKRCFWQCLSVSSLLCSCPVLLAASRHSALHRSCLERRTSSLLLRGPSLGRVPGLAAGTTARGRTPGHLWLQVSLHREHILRRPPPLQLVYVFHGALRANYREETDLWLPSFRIENRWLAGLSPALQHEAIPTGRVPERDQMPHKGSLQVRTGTLPWVHQARQSVHQQTNRHLASYCCCTVGIPRYLLFVQWILTLFSDSACVKC
jgi:hypothetical protein